MFCFLKQERGICFAMLRYMLSCLDGEYAIYMLQRNQYISAFMIDSYDGLNQRNINVCFCFLGVRDCLQSEGSEKNDVVEVIGKCEL